MSNYSIQRVTWYCSRRSPFTSVKHSFVPVRVGSVRITTLNYHIERGDTLSAIARRFKSSVIDMMEANAIKDPDKIKAGDILRITKSGLDYFEIQDLCDKTSERVTTED